MLMVGLTGGIGAGKSAVAKRLAELGAVIIDSDRLAREVVARGTDGLAAIVAAFGDGVLRPDGELDRPALGQKVFGDEAARRTLEAITHPLIRARAAQLARGAPADAIVVNDVPLLVETGAGPSYQLVLIVMTSDATRIRRLAETRGMSTEQARARIAAQATDDQRRAAADVLIDNEAGLDTLHEQVDRLWRDRLVPFEANLRLHQPAPGVPELRIVPYDPDWPDRAERLIARIRHTLKATAERPPEPAPTGAADRGSESAPPAAHEGAPKAAALGRGSETALPAAHERAAVSHVGSTAVPGMPAKDVIDLMLSVPSLEMADELAGALGRAGFPRQAGEWFDNARNLPGETWPKRLHGSADPACPVNLHVRVAGTPGWRFALLMRDHLRAVPEARDGYAEAEEPWFDREAVAADEWAAATGWEPSGS